MNKLCTLISCFYKIVHRENVNCQWDYFLSQVITITYLPSTFLPKRLVRANCHHLACVVTHSYTSCHSNTGQTENKWTTVKHINVHILISSNELDMWPLPWVNVRVVIVWKYFQKRSLKYISLVWLKFTDR